ncbi:hypothetical protein UA08_07430 [Talaromyces atroroseus]|uniref:Osmotin, thaumatin-like protein n=1 Tax=Talaromyces atroroseus TaxID=1441469 RepID=A0A225A9E7_TALAT|nr:hypothetical protein UA08_07430 [Talaromyces atroroseus]OKL57362.1 hypothetical protein UA08_07430 [Talaromyces atroroseus]
MKNAFSIATLLALASNALASPFPAATPTITSAIGTAVGGAASIKTQEAVLVEDPPEYLTIVIINSHGDDITTSLSNANTAATPVSGATGTGTMSNHETASVVVPTGWIGSWAINDALYEITGDDSLLEANFVVETGGTVATVDVDVSYVDGFSVAIVCSCDGTIVTGCNKNLFELNTCEDNDGENACVNPLRSDLSATNATTFFAPCQGAAYTFPFDSAADSTGQCQNGVIKCCVGAACPANPNQPSD